MEHITSDLIGKRVETYDGDEVGKVTAVEDGKAILDAPMGTAAGLQEYLTSDEVASDDEQRLALEPDRIHTVTDEAVTLRGE